jgi:isoleucyl-tRNA synthetase
MTINSALHADMDAARAITTAALEARSAAKIKVRQPLGELVVSAEHLLAKSFDKTSLLEIVASEVNVKKISVGTVAEGVVQLDTTVTPELQAEGYLRDLIRAVQDYRKQTGLNPNDLPVLSVAATGDAKVFIERYTDELVKATHLQGISFTQESVVTVNIGSMQIGLSL